MTRPGIDLLFEEFNQYLLHDGYLTAINDIALHGHILESTLMTYSDWIRGDMLRRGRQEHYLREILNAMIKRYGSQITWNNLAQDLSIDHPKTVSDYVALLASMDAVFIQDALLEDKLVAAPKKARKLMFIESQAILIKDLYATICHYGSFLKHIPTNQECIGDAFLQYYLLAKTLDTTRTIYRWLVGRYSDDVLMLVRLVYENYLHIIYLHKHPDAAEDFFARQGAFMGIYHYETNKAGKPNYRVIIDKESGKKYRGNISNREMAMASEFSIDLELYEQLYPLLCAYSHIGLGISLEYFNPKEGFLLHKEDYPFLALQWASIVNTLLLDELSHIKFIHKRTQRDLRFMANRLRTHLLDFFNLPEINFQSKLMGTVIERIRLVNTR